MWLTLRPAEMDFASAGDCGDEGWVEFTAEAAHFRQSEFEQGGHFQARQVAGGKDKFADGVFLEGAFFEQVVADALIAGQQHPAIATHQRQPAFIGRSTIEMSMVALETDTLFCKGVQNCAGIA